MRLIWKYYSKKEKILLLFICSLVLVQTIVETALPSKMGEITELIQTSETAFNHIISLAFEMTLYAVLAFFVSFLSGYLLSMLCASICKTIRQAMFEKIMDFSIVETNHFGIGALITRTTNDISVIENFVSSGIKPMVQAPFCAAVVLMRMSGGNRIWMMMGIAAVMAIFVFVIAVYKIVVPVISRHSVLRDWFSHKTKEHLTGIRVIHAYNAYKKQRSEYEAVNEEMVSYAVKQEKVVSAFMPFTMSLLYVVSIGIYFSGAFIIKNAGLDIRLSLYADMITYASYMTLIIVAFANLVVSIMMFPMTMNASKRIREVLDMDICIKDSEDTVKTEKKSTDVSLEFRNVSFKYHGADDYALKDISFDIKKGETLAIIGGIGCGKSTLLNLIPRLLEVSEGEIIVAGNNIKNYRLKELRNLIGYVPQKSFLFSGTVFNNINFGDNGRSKALIDEVVKAAQFGKADEFISQKENGYDSQVLMGGNNFSGGQKQRMTISRAVCRDPEILIFDDSFSALDFKTDKELRKGLKQLSKDKTFIIVGQRIGTIMDADKILVMDNGQIVGQGTHKELLDTCDVYKEIALSQLSEKEAAR